MAIPIVVYKNKAKQHSWARWMNNRTMRKNQNNLFSFVGATGTGKTWSALSVAEIMSKLSGVPFGIENVVFSLTELMNLINGGNLKRGSVIVFDEPQISISAREFQSLANKVFNHLLSTFRHRNFSLFFCCPFETLLDKNTRRLFHGRFETLSINAKNKTCRLKPRFVEYSDWKAEPYRKRMIVRILKGQGECQEERLDFWDIIKPSAQMIKDYEEKKLQFTTMLNKNISQKLAKYDEAGKSMTSDNTSSKSERLPLTDRQREVMGVLANNGYEKTREKLGINLSAIHANKTRALNKGYTLEEFRDT